MHLAIALVLGLLPSGAASPPPPGAIRVATFNASLNRDAPGKLLADLEGGDDPQIRNVAEIIQRVRPDILLINEFDYADDAAAARLFQTKYLAVGQQGAEPITYQHVYIPSVNTGEPSGADLDGNGKVVSEPGHRDYGGDAKGFGLFPGQYGMVLFSRFPLAGPPRTFRNLPWPVVPGALQPTKPDGSPFYPPAAANMPLSSKTHADIAITIGDHVIHVLASHPTPPAFDGPEQRNVMRNHDEIRLWADYLTGGEKAAYLTPDDEGPAAAEPPEHFVILGDLNADPIDGGGLPGAIDQLHKHPRVNASYIPTSKGAIEAARIQGEANGTHKGDPAQDTADFNDRAPGNLRVDYVLPSRTFTILAGGVFWPESTDALARLVAMRPRPASSDHRLVYLDLNPPKP